LAGKKESKIEGGSWPPFFIDGDKGSGIPGSRLWHIHWLNDLHDKDSVVEYTVQITSRQIDTSGDLNAVKLRALEAIDEAKNV
jgi:hypothetical protein